MTYGLEPKTELGEENRCYSIEDLVPGDPERMRVVATRYRQVARGAAQVQVLLQRVDAGQWVGDSGGAFREAVAAAPAPYAKVVQVFGGCAAALDGLAAEIEHARAVARRSVMRVQEAATISERWEADGRVGSDPGEPVREAAKSTLRVAQEEVQRVGDRTVGVLDSGSRDAPDGPGIGSVARGAYDSVVSTGRLAWALSPHRFATDPDQARDNYSAAGSSVKQAVLHPKESAERFLEELEEDPGYVLGTMAPGAVVGGGAGAAVGSRLASGLVPMFDQLSLGAGSPYVGAGGRVRYVDPPHDIDSFLTMLRITDVDAIAEHAYGKHVIKKREFGEVISPSAFAGLIDEAVRRPSEFYEIPGRRIYWDDANGLFVVSNDGLRSGSAYRPPPGLTYFARQLLIMMTNPEK